MLRKPHMRNQHKVCCSLRLKEQHTLTYGNIHTYLKFKRYYIQPWAKRSWGIWGAVLNYSEFGYVCDKVMTGLGAYFCYAISKTICLEFSEFRYTIPSFKNCENQDDSQKAFEKEILKAFQLNRSSMDSDGCPPGRSYVLYGCRKCDSPGDNCAMAASRS